jgi:hypothetical protein
MKIILDENAPHSPLGSRDGPDWKTGRCWKRLEQLERVQAAACENQDIG